MEKVGGGGEKVLNLPKTSKIDMQLLTSCNKTSSSLIDINLIHCFITILQSAHVRALNISRLLFFWELFWCLGLPINSNHCIRAISKWCSVVTIDIKFVFRAALPTFFK